VALTIRELTIDELESVAGGDAPHGAGASTEEERCVGWVDGFGGVMGFIFYFPC